MDIVVENFRGIQAAHITVSPLALLAGNNGAGKSSIALAVAATASSTAVPFAGVAKKDAGEMVRAGAKKGMATLTTPDGSSTVEWKPRGEANHLSSGTPPQASTIAVGLVDPLALKPGELLGVMIKALKADVTQADLARACDAKGLAEGTAGKVWPVVEKQGWDAAEKQARESGARLKGQWQEVAGEKYGEDKAATWVPATGWEPAMATTDIEKLRAALLTAQQALDGVAVGAATDEAERARLTDLAATVPALTEALAAAEGAATEAQTAFDAAEKTLADTPNPSAEPTKVECPDCQAKLVIDAAAPGGLAKPDKKALTGEPLKKARLAWAGASGDVQNKKTKLSMARQEVANARARLDTAEGAVTKLAAMPAPTVADPAQEAKLAAARAAVDTARGKVVAKEAQLRAATLHKQVADNQAIIDLLAESGLRKEKLGTLLESFASMYLHPTSATLGIQPVSVTPDMAVVCGVTPYRMLSRSEQYRVRACLQLCIARADGSQIVVLDDAEVLVSGPDRGKLLQAVIANGIPAVVAMAYKNQDGLPDLVASGQGTTYWVTGNTAAPYGAAAQAA